MHGGKVVSASGDAPRVKAPAMKTDELQLDLLSASTEASLGCALNGVKAADGSCTCDAAWEGAQCERFAFVPTSDEADLNSPWAAKDLETSTWGMGTLQRPLGAKGATAGAAATDAAAAAAAAEPPLRRQPVAAHVRGGADGELRDWRVADQQPGCSLGQRGPRQPVEAPRRRACPAGDVPVCRHRAQRDSTPLLPSLFSSLLFSLLSYMLSF